MFFAISLHSKKQEQCFKEVSRLQSENSKISTEIKQLKFFHAEELKGKDHEIQKLQTKVENHKNLLNKEKRKLQKKSEEKTQ